MKEYEEHLEEFSSIAYRTFSHMPRSEWGKREIAERYLEKYWLPRAEFDSYWAPIQNSIFTNQEKGYPGIEFRHGFRILPVDGGLIIDSKDLQSFQKCMRRTDDHYFVIIQNLFGKDVDVNVTPFMLKFPADISWEELMSGNYISSVLFEWSANEYFMYGDSGKWGQYSSSELAHSVNLIAFLEEYRPVFQESFEEQLQRGKDILQWLPKFYRKYL